MIDETTSANELRAALVNMIADSAHALQQRAVVNGAMEIAEGIAATAYGTPSEAADHFAKAAWWQSKAKEAEGVERRVRQDA